MTEPAVRLAELMTALSLATDLSMRQPSSSPGSRAW